MSDLTNEDQLAVLTSHKKNLEFNAYNLQVSIIEENAKDAPDSNSITILKKKIAEIENQKAALDTEIAKITPVTPA